MGLSLGLDGKARQSQNLLLLSALIKWGIIWWACLKTWLSDFGSWLLQTSPLMRRNPTVDANSCQISLPSFISSAKELKAIPYAKLPINKFFYTPTYYIVYFSVHSLNPSLTKSFSFLFSICDSIHPILSWNTLFLYFSYKFNTSVLY